MDAVWLRAPDFPVIVTTLVPCVAPLVAVNVMVLPVLVGFAEKAAVTPFGRPDAESVTLPVKPPVEAMAMPLDALPPCLTANLEGETVRVKLGAFTTNVAEEFAVV